jgi:DNA-binding PadR family transcriptional regulator
MDDSTPAAAQGVTGAAGTAGAESLSRFELAPPRRFMLPAILLLLSERPGYGYGLVPRLREFRLGHVDRPAVYRALSQLERDQLVESSSQHQTAGQSRRVYRITARGERVLRVWMGVIKEEHDCLGGVLRRYQATGTTDSVLAEVEGGWSAALGFGGSPVSSSLGGRRRVAALSSPPDWVPARPPQAGAAGPAPTSTPAPARAPREFRLVPDRSVVLIEVRSTVGPLSFGAIGVSGSIHAAVQHGLVDTDCDVFGRIVVDVSGLRSGNGLYDAELLRRIDARRFPTAMVDLLNCAPSGLDGRYHLEGAVTFHGVRRAVTGTVSVGCAGDRLVITGEQVLDIRDFAIPSPTVLMLRIYPDVRVRLQVEAEPEDAP